MENLYSVTEDPRLEAVYIFGSWLYKTVPDDIDLLIVFDPRHCPIEEALLLRRRLAQIVEETLELKSDIVLLTISEERQTDFIRSERCRPFTEAFGAQYDQLDE